MNYKINRPLVIGKREKVSGLMKDALRGKIMTEFVGFRPKTYLYLMNDDDTDKKATKKCVLKKQRLQFSDYKNFLLNNKIILKSQQRFKSEAHDVYTENINKTALSINDERRLQTSDRISRYPYGYKNFRKYAKQNC